MDKAFSDQLSMSLSDLLAAQTGLHFPKERWRDLERGIAAAAPAFGMPDAESCARRLLSAPLTRHQIEVLASHLTVGETYFFREKMSFEALEQHILPQLIRACAPAERRLRIWSAGCCTGEEPYSVAMLLDRLIPDQQDWNITLLATDLNPGFLRKAAEGVYGEWSFRDTPDWVRERYFRRRKDQRFEILPHIRKRVTFSCLNFADDVYPSLVTNTNAMDVILCRNVLMYFSPAWVEKVARNFHRSLVDGGWLVVGPAETSNRLFPQFEAIPFPGAVFYRKTQGAGLQAGAAGYSVPSFDLFDPLPETLQMPAAVANASVQSVAAEPVASHPSNRDERDALCRMAHSCANQGKLAEAIGWCEKAIAADKLDPATHYLLATILQEQGENELAVRSLLRALYLDPDFVLAHFSLGNLRLSQGRQREARRHFDNAQTLLHAHTQDEILPESEGLTAGRLGEIVASVRLSLPPVTAASG
ncbi:MAG: chemotaxis protein methyltransferase CheR [Rhodocyclaceae bacterium]|nr:MAG: chemotaxis protein methyltransferase CheR [Rhodocyclaceae bacterium]TND05458.1 MAG: chemotaxis protein methyltransferase CheR [Rhodocyclaceae bacterium]